MKVSLIIPHYKNAKATAHCIQKLLENKGSHEIEIIVGNNSGNENLEYLMPFLDKAIFFDYPVDLLQSHGGVIDIALEHGEVSNEWFITLVSDCYPTSDKWLDYYEYLISQGVDMAASLLWLSGGEFFHGAGALYNKTNWKAAKEYLDSVEYTYLPNFAMKEGFACHVMIHNSILNQVLLNPDDWVELAAGYKGRTKEDILKMAAYYKTCVKPFHCGIGANNESIHTYGQRCAETEVSNVILDNKKKILYRIGTEPSAWFGFWHLATGKKVHRIPTEVKWMPNREGQQQEYTLTENGLKHIWCGSSYLSMENTDMHDVYEFKKNQIEELYNSLPNHLKIQ